LRIRERLDCTIKPKKRVQSAKERGGRKERTGEKKDGREGRKRTSNEAHVHYSFLRSKNPTDELPRGRMLDIERRLGNYSLAVDPERDFVEKGLPGSSEGAS